MAYKIVWSNHAKNELKNTINYLIENWSDGEVIRLVNKLEKVTQLLSVNPYLFQASISHNYMRRVIVLKYNTLYFKVNIDQVQVVSFFSNRQSPKKRKI